MSDFNEKHIGINFEDFLKEEGILEETTAIAINQPLGPLTQSEKESLRQEMREASLLMRERLKSLEKGHKSSSQA